MIQHAEMQSERYLQKLGIKDILKMHGKLQCNKKSYKKIPNEAKKELTRLKTKDIRKKYEENSKSGTGLLLLDVEVQTIKHNAGKQEAFSGYFCPVLAMQQKSLSTLCTTVAGLEN